MGERVIFNVLSSKLIISYIQHQIHIMNIDIKI